MSESFQRCSACRLCGAANLQSVLELPPTPPGDHYFSKEKLSAPQERFPLTLCICDSCGHSQLLHVVAPEILYGNYIYETSCSLGLPEHFDNYSAKLLATIKPEASSLVIDIGSNDGTLLSSFQQRGLKVLGIDPAPEAARKANARGVPTLQTYFNSKLAKQIVAEHGRAAIVTANNVFANIDDLSEVVKGVATLLNEDGVFVFESGYFLDLVQSTLIDNIYHEHISYFAVKPLSTFFAEHGMELFDVEHVPTKGGSIRCFVQRTGATRSKTQVLKDLIELESKSGVNSSTGLQAFAKRSLGVRDELLQLVTNLKAEGKTIAGFGASVGVTTLLYFFELAEHLDFLVDDNPIRNGLYSPGDHLSVYSSEMLYQEKPDYVIVLAWRYLEPIVKKHQRYLDNGGKFIVPLPTLKVIE